VNPFYYVLGFLILQRLAELWLANRNTARLKARGAVETGASHYPLFVLLHTAWLAAMLVATPAEGDIHLGLLAAFALLQAGRIWVIATLGAYWTTRIVSLPDAPLIRAGPYRFLKHPNYVIVIGEVAVVPLMAGMIWIAVVFSVLNLALIAYRVSIENRVLDSRQHN
jgi:methyltransferase